MLDASSFRPSVCSYVGDDLYLSGNWDVLKALTVVANDRLLAENNGGDGFFSTIVEMASLNGSLSLRLSLWAFENLQNALEDVLGLTAALVIARNTYNTTSAGSTAIVRFDATQMGVGNVYGLVLAVPPLLVAAILVSLLIKRRQQGVEVVIKTSSLIDMLTERSLEVEQANISLVKPDRNSLR